MGGKGLVVGLLEEGRAGGCDRFLQGQEPVQVALQARPENARASRVGKAAQACQLEGEGCKPFRGSRKGLFQLGQALGFDVPEEAEGGVKLLRAHPADASLAQTGAPTGDLPFELFGQARRREEAHKQPAAFLRHGPIMGSPGITEGMHPAFGLPLLLLGQGIPLSQYKDPGYAKLVWVQSPHYNERPMGAPIDTIVLHHTAGSTLESCVKWFSSPDSKVSAHFTVGKDGSIVQHVSTFLRAWHAGVSRDKLGRESVNNFSIGIEMVNVGDGKDPWTKEQVEVVGFLIGALKRRFPEIKYVTSHEFIAVPRGRKPDPKNFPWEKLDAHGLELVYDMSKRVDPPADDLVYPKG
jgi:N-acetylmuramoyl-L-alanine amidase